MLTEICKEIRNWFSFREDRMVGKFHIESGVLTPLVSMLDGQYYRIIGSVFNDGVHKYGDENDVLTDEPEFDGAVWLMRCPKDFLDLVAEIEAWQEKNGAVDSSNMSPFSSESFGIYSYSKGSSGSSASGAGATAVTWQTQFKSRLNKYRKLVE